MALARYLTPFSVFIRTRGLIQIHAPLATSAPGDTSSQQQEAPRPLKGHVNAKKSTRVALVGGKRYLWCACGHSKNQPFCDGTHIWKRWKLNIKQHPVFFKAPKDMTASLCLCKQTAKPPYCDGSHRRPEVQEAVVEEQP